MKAALKSDTFRNKIKSYIAANICTDLDGADKNAVMRMLRKTAVSYSRPIDPHRPDYSIAEKTAELKLARTVQHHVCSKDTCLVSKKGSIYCKCRAPFDLSSRDYVDEDGSWRPKRTYEFINSWCPPIMQCMCSNQDIKLITSRAETINISFYILLYVAK